MDWYESFLNDLVLKDRESEGKIKKRNTHDMLLKKLVSDDENVFLEAYPEKERILKDWSNCAYYHKDSAFASQYCSMVGTVIVVLPPFKSDNNSKSEEKFYDYFNIKPCDFVKKYINVDGNEFILPFMLEADKYKQSSVRDVYEPIFKELKDMGDEKRYPAYANIMQDCLLRATGLTWDEFRGQTINIVKCKSYEPVTIGSLPIKDPKIEIGEKVALLRLINMDGLAYDILNLAKKDTDLAVKMCVTATALYTGPIFYTRKTLTNLAPSYDLQLYQTAIRGLMEFNKKSLGKYLTSQIKKDVCYLVNCFKNIGSLDSMEIKVPIPSNEEDRTELPNVMIKEGYGEIIREANQRIPELKTNLLKDTDKAREVRDEIVEMRNGLVDYYFNEFTSSIDFTVKTIETTLGFFDVTDVLGLHDIACFAKVVWGDKIKMDFETRCVESSAKDFIDKYPLLKYKPTIFSWEISSPT